MKQVFYVHSGITWLMAIGIVQKHSFRNQDVLILVGRGFTLSCPFEHTVLNEAEQHLASIPSYGSREVLRQLTTLKTLDKKLQQRVGKGDFVLYLPTERNYLMQYLQTHAQCAGRNFIEEGLLTYHGSFLKHGSPWSLRSRLQYGLRFPFHLNRTLVGKNYHRFSPDDFTVYVGTDTAQSMLSKFTVSKIDLPSLTGSFHHPLPEMKILFVFDPVVEKKICDSETFFRCLEDFVRVNLNPSEEVALKFHPQQVSFAMYLDVFTSLQISYRILPQDVIPEVLLMSSSGLRVLGLSSSVLFYAREWGHDVRSFSPALTLQSTSYANWVKASIPDFIVEKLNLI